MNRRVPSPSRRRVAVLAALLLLSTGSAGCGARFPRPAATAPADGTSALPPGEAPPVVVDPTTGETVPPAVGDVPSPPLPDAGAGGGPAGAPAPPAGAGTAPGGGGQAPPDAGAPPAAAAPPGAAPGTGPTAAPRPSATAAAPVEPGSTTGVTATSITLGYLIPKNGAAPVPPQVEDGIRAYWTFRNGNGGIHGRRVTVRVYDTGSTEDGARRAAQEAIDDDVFAVIALDRLGVQGVIARYLDQRGVPNLAVQLPVGFPASLRWTFGVSIDHREQGALIADYMARVVKPRTRKVAVVYETDDTLDPGVGAFVARARAQGLDVVERIQIDGTQSQFLSQAQRLASSGAEVVWLYMAPTPAANIARTADSNGYRPVWFANSVSWNFNLGLAAGGDAMSRARAFSPWPAYADARTGQYRPYAAAGDAKLKDLGIPGWGLGQIVANAAQAAGKRLGRNSFRAAMQSLRLGATSPIDRGPMLWAPVEFGPGVRNGVRAVATYRANASTTNPEWLPEADFRSQY